MTEARLLAVTVYPEKGEPGRGLSHATVLPEGLEGNRAKRHALLVATREDVATTAARGEELRANLLVDLPSAVLQAAVGERLQVGDVVVRIDRKPSACEGMYADVVTPGEVAVGDLCRLATPAEHG